MDYYVKQDEKFRKPLLTVQIIYCIAALVLVIHGIHEKSGYIISVSAGTVLLIPCLPLAAKLFHLKRGIQMELYVYIFSFLGWTLGGAAMVYDLLPGFDKVVHFLSGIFVSMIAMCIYEMLQRGSQEENRPLRCLFIFFASVAVAGLFELCEFALTPVMGRDLQHVIDTGVTDTMQDIIACTAGTVAFLLVSARSAKGKHDPFTNAAMAFTAKNRREPAANKK